MKYSELPGCVLVGFRVRVVKAAQGLAQPHLRSCAAVFPVGVSTLVSSSSST